MKFLNLIAAAVIVGLYTYSGLNVAEVVTTLDHTWSPELLAAH